MFHGCRQRGIFASLILKLTLVDLDHGSSVIWKLQSSQSFVELLLVQGTLVNFHQILPRYSYKKKDYLIYQRSTGKPDLVDFIANICFRQFGNIVGLRFTKQLIQIKAGGIYSDTCSQLELGLIELCLPLSVKGTIMKLEFSCISDLFVCVFRLL